jgi:hypothetical protein
VNSAKWVTSASIFIVAGTRAEEAG